MQHDVAQYGTHHGEQSDQGNTGTARFEGAVDRVADVKLLQGDLAESWREAGVEYATVAMRFSSLNALVEREGGRVVEGHATIPREVTELWTFVRPRGGQWQVSAIQPAE